MHRKDIEIPEPCHADWATMRPEEQGRFCFECSTKVHDLSAMTEPEAKEFLRRTACADVCVSYELEDDGRLSFREPAVRMAPPPALVPLARLRRPRSVAAAVAGAGMAVAMAACTPHSDTSVRSYASEAPVFQTERVVIPLGTEAPPTLTPPPVQADVADEPCEPTELEPIEPAATEERRVRGRMKPRLAGKPMPRKTGKIANPLDFD